MAEGFEIDDSFTTEPPKGFDIDDSFTTEPVKAQAIPGVTEDIEFGQRTGQADYNRLVEEQAKAGNQLLADISGQLQGGKSFEELDAFARSRGGSLKDPDVWKQNIALRDAGKQYVNPALQRLVDPAPIPTPDVPEEGRGAADRFTDSLKAASQQDFWGLFSRTAHDWMDTGKEELRQAYPGQSDDFYEYIQEEFVNQSQRRLREEYAAKQAADPAWRPDESFLQNALSIDRWGPTVLGGIVGSADPTMLVAPGSSIASRAAGQAAVQGTTNAAYQGADVYQGVADEYDPLQTATVAAFGGVAEAGLAKAGQAYRGARAGREVPTVKSEAAPTLSEALDHIRATKKDWQNSPKFEVSKNFNHLPDIDKDAVGVFDTETGKVRINMSAVDSPETLSAVVYHEALGHHGLQQKFGDELDRVLDELYNNSKGSFRQSVDDWMAKNPDAYVDDLNPVGRAAEEVLAEMSQSGKIDRTVFDKIKDVVKNFARDLGLDLKYSDREVKSILGMAHDAVVKGKGRDVIGNGFRYKAEVKTGPFKEVRETSDGTKFLEYTTKSGDTIPIKMAIDDGTAEMAIDQFSTQANRLGPREIREAMGELQKLYPEIKRFGGYRRSGAGAGRVQEIEAPRRANARYMRKAMGSGSEGPLRGSIADETHEGPYSAVGKYRSDRNLDEIFAETATPTERQSWSEWIDEAGNIKVTQKMAENLASGTEVPQLKAVEDYLVRVNNTIHDLSRRIADGEILTERETYRLSDLMSRSQNIDASIRNVVTNAARILNSRNITVETDAFLQAERVRKMLARIPPELLATPEGAASVAKGLVKDVQKAKRLEGVLRLLGNTLGLPRTLRSSMDLSAPLRQGLPFISKGAYWQALPAMFKYAWNGKEFDRALRELKKRPTYKTMEDAGLYLADPNGRIGDKEEAFISSVSQKIPGVAGSERAYVGFLNQLRADVFDDLLRQSAKAGQDLTQPHNREALKGLAEYVNTMTGRGGKTDSAFSRASPWLAVGLFSPRLIASRINILANPAYYMRLPPVARKDAIRSLLALGGIAGTVLGLAKMNGYDVETDARSSDFLKIRDGNLRYDILGGFSQYLTLAERTRTGERKTLKGRTKKLEPGFGKETRWDVATKTLMDNKLSPNAAFLANYLRGENVVGREFDWGTDVPELVTPMFLSDLKEVVDEQGDAGALKALPGIFGVSVSAYGTGKAKEGETADDRGQDITDEFTTEKAQ